MINITERMNTPKDTESSWQYLELLILFVVLNVQVFPFSNIIQTGICTDSKGTIYATWQVN